MTGNYVRPTMEMKKANKDRQLTVKTSSSQILESFEHFENPGRYNEINKILLS